jgi:ferredoxin
LVDEVPEGREAAAASGVDNCPELALTLVQD